MSEAPDRPETPAPASPLPRPPEEMRLRPARPPVTRLSRKVLLAAGTLAAVGVGGALFFALKPQPGVFGKELVDTNNRNPPDGLARLPKDYAGLGSAPPKLGPPLPGDLGKPILDAGAPAPGTATGQADPEAQRLAQARQQIAEEKAAALTSHLFASTGAAAGGAEAASAPQAMAGAVPSLAEAAQAPTKPAAGAVAAGADRKLAFLNAEPDRTSTASERIEAPASPYVVQAGAVIPASLITGLRSDLPGEVTAQVTEDVYDSPTGAILLIPQGARLIGQYDAQVAFGQSRALLVWTRLIYPNGRSIVLERQPGAGPEGYAGLSDRVNNHWGALIEAAVLSTILSVGAEAGTSDAENNLAQAIREGASQSISQTGQQVVSRSLNVSPTITIRPGYPVRVMVTRDLVLEPYRG